ncbi:uncharacterized protein LOC126549318 [Aphis gossypii]|uniref:uncharacterized protein LOC126549318 n=1 Tax=Aphis gossypii TaxID=80765 RepID=UPI00215963F1|nr:uncharacterized protein LOC126549318 [Aphis gossypii]
MLKAVSLIEKDISELQQFTKESASTSENNGEPTLLDIVDIDDSSSVCSVNSETCTENNVDLDEDQIIELLAENTEENTYCLDYDYEQTENILNEIQSFQNIRDNSSIFTGVRCVAHTLQLAVLDSLKDHGIEKLLNKY